MGKINTKKVLQFLIAFMIILDCETIWKWIEGSGFFKLAISIIIITSLFFINLNQKKLKLNKFLIVFLYLIGLAIINIFKGAYSIIPLCLTILLLYLYFNVIAKELNKKEVLIFSLTIFSTLSLTGIALVVFIWILYFLFKENINNKTKLLKKILIILVLIVISPKMIDIASKVLAIKSDSASYSTRLDNYYAGYKAWKENPLFGSGYLDMSVIKKHYSAFRLNDIGYTNSPFRVLAQGGIYMSILYLATIIKGLLGSIKNRNIFFCSYMN